MAETFPPGLEPALGPRQAALVDAVTHRLRGGDSCAEPFGKWDYLALLQMLSLLGLNGPPAPDPMPALAGAEGGQ